MKNRNVVVFAVIILTALGSCKKGDEDPFFSLMSRKARISGEWKLSSYSLTSTHAFNGNEENTTGTGNENEIVTTTTGSSYPTTVITKTIRDYSMTINKDGTWSALTSYDLKEVVTNPDFTTTSTGTTEIKESGSWAFVGKTKDEYKNKERINLSALSINITYGILTHSTSSNDNPTAPPIVTTDPAYTYSNTLASGNNTRIYDLVMLKSKEMKWTTVQNSLANYDLDGIEQYLSTGESVETFIWVSN